MGWILLLRVQHVPRGTAVNKIEFLVSALIILSLNQRSFFLSLCGLFCHIFLTRSWILLYCAMCSPRRPLQHARTVPSGPTAPISPRLHSSVMADTSAQRVLHRLSRESVNIVDIHNFTLDKETWKSLSFPRILNTGKQDNVSTISYEPLTSPQRCWIKAAK